MIISLIDCGKLFISIYMQVIKFESEGLVARSGIPSQVQVPGITNGGELGNWALTQVNMIPVSASATPTEVSIPSAVVSGYLIGPYERQYTPSKTPMIG